MDDFKIDTRKIKSRRNGKSVQKWDESLVRWGEGTPLHGALGRVHHCTNQYMFQQKLLKRALRGFGAGAGYGAKHGGKSRCPLHVLPALQWFLNSCYFKPALVVWYWWLVLPPHRESECTERWNKEIIRYQGWELSRHSPLHINVMSCQSLFLGGFSAKEPPKWLTKVKMQA